MSGLEIAVAAYVAYLIGSISSAIIVSRIMRLPDPRKKGSHNPGATNVLRLGGKKAAAITLAGDLLKGLLPVVVARWIGFDSNALMLMAFCAFLGHVFPIYYKFAGGKGVATYLGCLLGLNWLAGLSWIATWLIVAFVFRYSSLASLLASLLAPMYMWFFTGDWIWVAVLSVMTLVLVIRHSENISKLARGMESKIGSKKSQLK